MSTMTQLSLSKDAMVRLRLVILILDKFYTL